MKRARLAAGILAVLALAGCSSESTAQDASSAAPSPTTPTPTPTPEIIVWAGEVCVARDALLASVVDMATSLTYDPQDPASVGEQFQRQIPGQLDGVEAAARGLGTALGDVPVDYVEAAAAITALQGDLDRLSASKDTALGHVSAAQGAGDPVSAGVEWWQAAVAAKETYDAGMVVKDSLGTLVDSADGDVGNAFATAPECR